MFCDRHVLSLCRIQVFPNGAGTKSRIHLGVKNIPKNKKSKRWWLQIQPLVLKCRTGSNREIKQRDGWNIQRGRMTEKYRVGSGMYSLAPHFFVILPSWVLQSSCCVSSLMTEALITAAQDQSIPTMHDPLWQNCERWWHHTTVQKILAARRDGKQFHILPFRICKKLLLYHNWSIHPSTEIIAMVLVEVVVPACRVYIYLLEELKLLQD